jgi:hypothetical protein
MPAKPAKPRPTPPVIVVAGDVTVDWLAQSDVDWLASARARDSGGGPADRRHQNWQLRRGTRMEARPGGALLLAREIALALGGSTPQAVIRTHHLRDLRNVSPDRALHSVVELTPGSGRDQSLRVDRYLGFSGPLDGAPDPLPVAHDDPAAQLVVLDDAGNGFRDHPEVWPAALGASGRAPLVIMKVSRPLSGGPLFTRVREAHRDRLILVINADDLRAEGVDISRQLSWERSAREFLWQIGHNPDLELLRDLPCLLVRFDLDGVIQYTGASRTPAARLFYDPAVAEGGWRERCHGGMVGLTDVFVAALAARVMREGEKAVSSGIEDGIRSTRRFFQRGIDPRTMDYPGAEVFGPPDPSDSIIADAVIPASSRRDAADPDFWSLLTELRGPGLERLARQLVLEGETSTLRTVPVGEFGDLRTVDRAEIESYRGIRNLIAEYLSRPPKRPLSIAVFGPPGSGKSFGVEQVARSVARLSQVKIEKIEFNLSQFESSRDLVAALHRVRDDVLRGRIPLVFFDEFDSARDGPLGWLRAFLAPMQDGAFKDGEGMHPIGRAIFVFAGGLSDTLARFARDEFPDDMSEAARSRERDLFREAKGPDFVSRLRGYVNVLGPNPVPGRPDDRLYLIRRATILRSLLLRNCAQLADPANPRRLRVDEGVLRALIGVPLYRHGVRSMEALLDMSRLEGRGIFDPSALPSPDQLDQHVSAPAFSKLVLQGVLFAAAKEAIAEALHERYRGGRAARRRRDPALLPWAQLDEVYRRSNLAQAEDILRKLELVGCGYRPRGERKGAAFRFRAEEIERLAEREHERYTQERVQEGFTPGPRRSLRHKTSPYLVPWEQLGEPARQLDRQAVAVIPEVLGRAGFEVYRLNP